MGLLEQLQHIIEQMGFQIATEIKQNLLYWRFNMEVVKGTIWVSIIENRNGWFPISSATAYFLDVIFKTFREADVHHKSNIRLVNSKSKGNSGDHDLSDSLHPAFLDFLSLVVIHAGMIRLTIDVMSDPELVGGLFSVISAGAVNNPTFVLEFVHYRQTDRLQHIFRLFNHFDLNIWTIQVTSKENRVLELENLNQLIF